MIYLFDTTAISDVLIKRPAVLAQVRQAFGNRDALYLCPPSYYEAMRGLLVKNAVAQIQRLENEVRPIFGWQPLTDADWQQAAQYWADARRAGKQLSDVDLLLAALVNRLNATLISSDDDFDALPIKREDWRR